MKTNSNKTNARTWRCAAISFVLLLLATCPRNALAQTNTFPANGNVGVGTTSPSYPLEVVGNSQWTARFKKTDATHGGILIDAATGFNPNVGMSVNGVVKWYMNSNTADGDTLQFWETTGSNPRFTLTQAGSVGIGTASPSALLDLKGNNVPYGGQLRLQATDYDQITFYNSNNPSLNGANRLGDIFYDVANSTMYIDNQAGNKYLLLNQGGGNVGIGTPNPQYKLDVAGNINSSATITGNNIVAKYQDVAEWVPAAEQLPAGTVVVLDHTKSNQVISSTQAYDTRVAGVISAQPGIALGESGENKVLVATTGRVRVKVDASRGPIHIGDLLVTSDTPGAAMKSQPVNIGGVELHRPGTLIGKALEPLAKGTGEILVLLSLQ